jgi:hypothetical protein
MLKFYMCYSTKNKLNTYNVVPMNVMVQGTLSLCFAQHAVVQLVEPPSHKPENYEFDSLWATIWP